MKSLLFTFALTLIATLPSYSQSQRELQASAKEFLSMTRSPADNCHDHLERATPGPGSSGLMMSIDRVVACINDEKGRIHPRFEAIRDSLEDKKELQTALKEYYAYWLSTMDAINPRSASAYKSKQDWRRHLGERIQKLKEMANRIIADF